MNEKKHINIFDFDGTITTETWPKFWVWAKRYGYDGTKRNDKLEEALADYRKTHVGDHLETFFGFFNDLLEDNNETLSIEELMEGEKYIKYNKGFQEFIKNSKAKNYIVSGGLVDFLKGLKISMDVAGIYGSSMKFNSDGLISGIGEIMTDDKKIDAIKDILKKNGRRVDDCRNVCYIGDGYSDAVAMRYVHENGGTAIFVYHSKTNDELQAHNDSIFEKLNEAGIVDYYCVADYTQSSELFNLLEK